jgi:hypothetical protein
MSLDAAAAALAEQARVVPGLLDRALARSGVDVWQGPAQERLLDDLRGLRSVLRVAADELAFLATRLRAEAEEARLAQARASAAAAASATDRRVR